MDRKQALYQGISLIVVAAIGVAILASNHVLIVGGLPIVLPIAGLLVAIGVVRIVAGVSEGWTRGLGILGAIAGALGSGYGAIASKIDDPVAPVVLVGMGAILPALVLAPIGKLIDHWIAGGFRAVRFRLLGVLLGLGAGLALSIPAYRVHLEWGLDGRSRNALLIAESLGLLYAGLVVGWIVDRLVATRGRALRTIYALELVLWIALAAALEVVAGRSFTSSGLERGGVAAMTLGIYPMYLFYLWLWRIRKGWSWIVLFFTSGFLMALPILLVGDALRRVAYLAYTAEKPVKFAFGRQGQGDPFRQKLRSGAMVWLVLLLAVGAFSALLFYAYIQGTQRPVAIAWPEGAGYLTPAAHRPPAPHAVQLTWDRWEFHGSVGNDPLLLAPGHRVKNHTAYEDTLSLQDYNGDTCIVPYGLTVWVDEYGQFVPIQYDPTMPPPTIRRY